MGTVRLQKTRLECSLLRLGQWLAVAHAVLRFQPALFIKIKIQKKGLTQSVHAAAAAAAAGAGVPSQRAVPGAIQVGLPLAYRAAADAGAALHAAVGGGGGVWGGCTALALLSYRLYWGRG